MGVSGMMTQVQEPLVETVRSENSTDTKDSDGDPHLRSTHKVTGYSIKAIDGKIGDIEDFIIDDKTWKIDFIEVDTGHWFPGKKTLVLPKLIQEIDWINSSV